MERRKVQVTGGSTFIVSLPKKWVDAQGLRQGDAVDVHWDRTGPVTVYPVGRRGTPQRAWTIDIGREGHPQDTIRRIISAYLAGYETLTIQSAHRIPMDHKQAIRDLAQTLIGIEIVEESQTQITLQDLIDPNDFDMQKALERMHQIARAMVEDAVVSLVEADPELAHDVLARDPEVDRLDWMIKKQFHLIARSGRLAGELGMAASEALHHLLVSHNLERIADHASRLAELTLDDGTAAIPAATLRAAQDQAKILLGHLDDAVTAFQKADSTRGNRAIDHCKNAKQNARDLLSQRQGSAASQIDLALMVESLERIRNYTMDIAEVAIDHETILAEA